MADRLGRFVASEVTWDGVPLTSIALDEVRARILVADHDSYLFAGTLREILHVRADLGDADLRAALRTASAEDLLDAHPDGSRCRSVPGPGRSPAASGNGYAWPAPCSPSRTCSFSSTRLGCGRAHRGAHRAAAPGGAGRTDHRRVDHLAAAARSRDLVAHLRDGRIVTVGAHVDLLEQDPSYRALVSRDNEPADVDGSLR